jgi:predicted DNA-binding transcriptional regulator YafY
MAAETGWKQEPDDQSERLYSLTLALVQTEIGFTKEEIFNAIRGYRLDLERAGGLDGDLVALNKKFDRDKEKLRELGVQIIPGANSSDGDADFRYRISREIFKWPSGTSLTAKQLQLLELAASVWDRAALSPEATNAITRLRAISELGDATISQAIAPRINTIEPSFGPLKKAIEESVRVNFVYRRQDGVESLRMVEPWQLVHVAGVWMLLAFDVERGAPRNFLLKRIHSKVTRTKELATSPTVEQIQAAKTDLAKVFEANKARIRVRPGTTAAMHFETHNLASGELEINYYDLALLAEELLEFGQSIQVLSPPELIDHITHTLEQVVKNHA